MCATSFLRREAGRSTRSRNLWLALPIAASMSLKGSKLIIILSPARLRHAGDLPAERELSEANTAEPEVPVEPPGPAAQAAAAAEAHRELLRFARFGHPCFCCHIYLAFLNGMPSRLSISRAGSSWLASV